MAESDLDSAEASATLIVQDVPNPPNLKWVDCYAKDATVVWQPMGDNRAPILTYKIQYNTSFTKDTWETATGWDGDKGRFTGLSEFELCGHHKACVK